MTMDSPRSKAGRPAIIAVVNANRCDRCNLPHETGDNFCRRCGRSLSAGLPAIRPVANVTTPSRSSALAPSLVSSVAVLALGTGLEWVARRLMGTAARKAGRALVSGGESRPVPREQTTDDTIDELVYVRKIQLRR